VAVRTRCAAWESNKQSNQNPNYMSETKKTSKKDIRDLKPSKDAKGGGSAGTTAGRGIQKPQ